MDAPRWLSAAARTHVDGEFRTVVGVLGDDGGQPRLADADRYELRMGSDETVHNGYLGLVVVTPERMDDPSHLVRATRMQVALQMLADLGVKAFVRGGLVVLEARW